MAISDKTRKILWGRSGNRCAVCQRELVVDATPDSDDSVVGDECHIVSGKGLGPRHDPAFLEELLDQPENLVLLCRVHHKMVDDQVETYPVAALRALKSKHEHWVSSTLGGVPPYRPARFVRIRKNMATLLPRLASGKAIFDVLHGAVAYGFEHDEPQSDDETELVAGFFQNIQDWGDLVSDMEAGERVRAQQGLGAHLREVEDAGFLLYGATEIGRLEGGEGPPSRVGFAIFRLVRRNADTSASVTGAG